MAATSFLHPGAPVTSTVQHEADIERLGTELIMIAGGLRGARYTDQAVAEISLAGDLANAKAAIAKASAAIDGLIGQLTAPPTFQTGTAVRSEDASLSFGA